MITGYTCSCFDLLHAGHILMLEEAKQYVDRLGEKINETKL